MLCRIVTFMTGYVTLATFIKGYVTYFQKTNLGMQLEASMASTVLAMVSMLIIIVIA